MVGSGSVVTNSIAWLKPKGEVDGDKTRRGWSTEYSGEAARTEGVSRVSCPSCRASQGGVPRGSEV